MTYQLTPLSRTIGVEIRGVDLGAPPDERTLGLVLAALDQWSVVALRDQHLTPDQQIAFSRRLGPLEIHIQKRFHLAGHPEILVVSNVIENGQPIGLADAGRYWHSDLSYLAEPSMASLLYAREIPDGVGDTLFVDMHGAYQALDEPTKRRIEGRTALHDYNARNEKQAAASGLRPRLSEAEASAVPAVAHPVVRRHPATGRRCLFVSEGFTTRILDVAEDESEAILGLLFAHMTRPELIYRHRWLPHDLVIWDNRATTHLATSVPPDRRRTLHRTTVRGPVPVGADRRGARGGAESSA